MSTRAVIFHESHLQGYLTGISHFGRWCKIEILQLPGITTHFCCPHPSSEMIAYGSGHAQLPLQQPLWLQNGILPICLLQTEELL